MTKKKTRILPRKKTDFQLPGVWCRTKLLWREKQEEEEEDRESCCCWTLILDSLYLSLCIELSFDGSREVLVAVLGVAYVAGELLAG